jgi:hypothetical protein
MIGCKLLNRIDDQSARSLTMEYTPVVYRRGEWNEVPGNGAYVAITGGLTSGGMGDTLAYLECEGEVVGCDPPNGVRCFRRVQWIADAPERISPELRGAVAHDAPDLSADQRMALALESTPEWRGWVACSVPDLSAEQRMALARESTPKWRGWVACSVPDLSAEQRMALARESTPELRGRVARSAPDLSADQRMALALESTPEWRGAVAHDAPDLSADQRMELRKQ